MCGEEGYGAAMKLMVNALFAAQVGVMAELLGVAQGVGMSGEDAIKILAQTPVCSPAAAAMSRMMLAHQHSPMFPVELVVKDLGYARDALAGARVSLSPCEATSRLYQEAMRQGLGGLNITSVRQLFE